MVYLKSKAGARPFSVNKTMDWTPNKDPCEPGKIVCENHALLNAFRRTILSDIECFAYDEVEILLNESTMCDAELEHRITLLPVKYGKEDRIEVNIYNIDDDTKMVKSEDIPGYAFEDIPLCQLPAEKQLEFTAIIKKGTASQHSKWAAVSVAHFENDTTLSFETIGNISADYIKKQAFTKLRKYFVDIARCRSSIIATQKHRRHTIGHLMREVIIKMNDGKFLCGYHLTDTGIEMYIPVTYDEYGVFIDLNHVIVAACNHIIQMIDHAASCN